MNNKLMSYEEAKSELKGLENFQRKFKKARKTMPSICSKATVQSRVSFGTVRINELLTIIHLHKQARRLYGKLQEALREEK